MLASTPADRIMVMNYEDFGRSPEDTQRRLYRFFDVADIAPPTEVAPSERHVIGNTLRMNDRLKIRLVESRREELTAAEQDRVLRVTGPMARTLGINLD